MSNEHVHQLVALITEAAKTIEEEYAKGPDPTIPTLDDTKAHLADTIPPSATFRKALALLEGASAQLLATVAPPSHTIVNRAMSFNDSGCLDVLVQNKIPDILKGKSDGVPIADISGATGLNEGKLERILRRLASTHILQEVKQGVFANNRLSQQLISENDLSAFTKSCTVDIQTGARALNAYMNDHEMSSVELPQNTPWNKGSGYPKPWFAWFQETPEGAQSAINFNRSMSAFIPAVGREAIVDGYPWKDLPEGASVCDMGGNLGQFLVLISRKYPHLKLKLQDLPAVIEEAKNDYWPKEAPQALESQTIEFKAMDFTSEAPIPGCDVYFLSMVVHDWPDEVNIEILKLIKSVMKPDSRVLISEIILPPLAETPNYERAPQPLLPNGGVGAVRAYNLDISMMILVGAKERNLRQIQSLGDSAGLKFVKRWDMGETDLLEFTL